MPWLSRELRVPTDGVATLVFHSSLWAYLGEAERAELTSLMEAAGSRASSRAPIAWLRLEDYTSHPELRVRLWPDGEDTRLAEAVQAHGRWVRWVAAD